ncbi:phosphoserine aminotransferase [Stutzerimonas stutzeri]|uniref:phosphoserine aminotransferase n=1 Tax=Stutzerimonas stutzeri TaxID=316 RepID=UPI0015E322DB|nr:phosphoserine aminotransferase [Stutzerimonas stutzeri]MBA1265730.1 phosphoserine aminotransferase [Stutzerimonas stutzeri]
MAEPAIHVMGLAFPSVLGIAAGFDPLGQLGRSVSAAGFGFTEIGSLDAAALPSELAFNQQGSARLGINLRLDPSRSDAQLCQGLARAWAHADYLMLNLIGPGSEVLLDSRERPRLRRLLSELLHQRHDLEQTTTRHVPLAVKVRSLPGQIPLELAQLLLELGFDGLLAAHDPGPPATRQRYLDWQNPAHQEQACRQIEALQRLCAQDMALMSVGGIQTREHLQARLAAGAGLVQVHSVLLQQGPWFAGNLLSQS